jgi:hypothetical protein
MTEPHIDARPGGLGMLDLAPAPRDPWRAVWVLLGGALTTVLALAGAWATDQYWHENLMGLYLWAFFPVGAMLVGAVASLGYALAAWWCGVRPRGWLLLAIMGLLIISYFLAQYFSFRMAGPLIERGTGKVVGFWRYYHVVTMSMSMTTEKFGKSETGSALKEAGYLLRFAEIAGFVGIGLLIPFALRLNAYCDVCERYMRSRRIAVMPITIVDLDILKDVFDVDRGEKGRARMSESGEVGELKKLAAAGDVAGFRAAMERVAVPMKQGRKAKFYLEIMLASCEQCFNGRMDLNLVRGHRRERSTTRVFRLELVRPFVRGILEPAAEDSLVPAGVVSENPL